MSSDETDLDFDETPLDSAFVKATDHVRKITGNLDNTTLLQFYGLYKQSTEGKCNIAKPGWLDGRGCKKWDAWNNLGDMPKEEAKQKYIDLLQKIDADFKSDENPKESWISVSSLRYSPEPELKQNQMTFLEAARENCIERLQQLLNDNPSAIYEKDSEGMTALHWAADRNASDALEVVINGGCDINAVDDSGQTALHYAASCGHVKSTEILVNASAKMLKDNDGCTPNDVASDNEIKSILSNVKSV